MMTPFYLKNREMTYLEAYNHYLSKTESNTIRIENLIAEQLENLGLKYGDDFEYSSFLETVRLHVFDSSLSTKKLISLSKNVLKNEIKNPRIKVLKTETIDKTEFILTIEF